MRVHGICIVRDEADVFEECITAALLWCDHVYVFDNGSIDGTWELVQKLAERHPQIVPYKREDTCFSDGLRADIFNEFRARCHPSDWWCRLDADEFYIDDPRIFLAKVPFKYDTVWTASFSYYFTDKDAELYRENPAKYSATPVQQRLRYYVNHWSEPRFIRHRDSIVWTREHGGWPESMSQALAYPVRIWVKHYAYRSPEQIERRLLSRRPAIESGKSFSHEAVANWSSAVASVRQTRAGFANYSPKLAARNWEERIVSASSLDFDNFDRRYNINENIMPRIQKPRYFNIKKFVPLPMRKLLKGLLSISEGLLNRER